MDYYVDNTPMSFMDWLKAIGQLLAIGCGIALFAGWLALFCWYPYGTVIVFYGTGLIGGILGHLHDKELARQAKERAEQAGKERQ